MSAGMELMGQRECASCGDPYTVTVDDAGQCGWCQMTKSLTALRARITELEAQLAAETAKVVKMTEAQESLKDAYSAHLTKHEGVPGWVALWDDSPDEDEATKAWTEALTILAGVKP